MQISADFPLPQVVTGIELLFFVIEVAIPYLVFFLLPRFGCRGWLSFPVSLFLSLLVTAGYLWFEGFSTGLLLDFYGYGADCGLAGVSPENMQKVDLLLDEKIDDYFVAILFFAINVVYCLAMYFLLNIARLLFGLKLGRKGENNK